MKKELSIAMTKEKEEFSKKIGEVIKYYRGLKKITLRELADEVGGYTFAYLSLIERGNTTPNSFVLYRIAKVLNVPMSILLGEGEKEDILLARLKASNMTIDKLDKIINLFEN